MNIVRNYSEGKSKESISDESSADSDNGSYGNLTPRSYLVRDASNLHGPSNKRETSVSNRKVTKGVVRNTGDASQGTTAAEGNSERKFFKNNLMSNANISLLNRESISDASTQSSQSESENKISSNHARSNANDSAPFTRKKVIVSSSSNTVDKDQRNNMENNGSSDGTTGDIVKNTTSTQSITLVRDSQLIVNSKGSSNLPEVTSSASTRYLNSHSDSGNVDHEKIDTSSLRNESAKTSTSQITKETRSQVIVNDSQLISTPQTSSIKVPHIDELSYDLTSSKMDHTTTPSDSTRSSSNNRIDFRDRNSFNNNFERLGNFSMNQPPRSEGYSDMSRYNQCPPSYTNHTTNNVDINYESPQYTHSRPSQAPQYIPTFSKKYHNQVNPSISGWIIAPSEPYPRPDYDMPFSTNAGARYSNQSQNTYPRGYDHGGIFLNRSHDYNDSQRIQRPPKEITQNFQGNHNRYSTSAVDTSVETPFSSNRSPRNDPNSMISKPNQNGSNYSDRNASSAKALPNTKTVSSDSTARDISKPSVVVEKHNVVNPLPVESPPSRSNANFQQIGQKMRQTEAIINSSGSTIMLNTVDKSKSNQSGQKEIPSNSKIQQNSTMTNALQNSVSSINISITNTQKIPNQPQQRSHQNQQKNVTMNEPKSNSIKQPPPASTKPIPSTKNPQTSTPKSHNIILDKGFDGNRPNQDSTKWPSSTSESGNKDQRSNQKAGPPFDAVASQSPNKSLVVTAFPSLEVRNVAMTSNVQSETSVNSKEKTDKMPANGVSDTSHDPKSSKQTSQNADKSVIESTIFKERTPNDSSVAKDKTAAITAVTQVLLANDPSIAKINESTIKGSINQLPVARNIGPGSSELKYMSTNSSPITKNRPAIETLVSKEATDSSVLKHKMSDDSLRAKDRPPTVSAVTNDRPINESSIDKEPAISKNRLDSYMFKDTSSYESSIGKEKLANGSAVVKERQESSMLKDYSAIASSVSRNKDSTAKSQPMEKSLNLNAATMNANDRIETTSKSKVQSDLIMKESTSRIDNKESIDPSDGINMDKDPSNFRKRSRSKSEDDTQKDKRQKSFDTMIDSSTIQNPADNIPRNTASIAPLHPPTKPGELSKDIDTNSSSQEKAVKPSAPKRFQPNSKAREINQSDTSDAPQSPSKSQSSFDQSAVGPNPSNQKKRYPGQIYSTLSETQFRLAHSKVNGWISDNLTRPNKIVRFEDSASVISEDSYRDNLDLMADAYDLGDSSDHKPDANDRAHSPVMNGLGDMKTESMLVTPPRDSQSTGQKQTINVAMPHGNDHSRRSLEDESQSQMRVEPPNPSDTTNTSTSMPKTFNPIRLRDTQIISPKSNMVKLPDSTESDSNWRDRLWPKKALITFTRIITRCTAVMESGRSRTILTPHWKDDGIEAVQTAYSR